MEHSGYHSKQQTRNEATSSFERIFMDGMHAYAVSRPGQLALLCRFSAAAIIGVLLGIFCFYFFGISPISDTQTAARDYLALRSFSSYDTMKAYLSFFGAWFSHHALLTVLPLLTVITVYPIPLCCLITALRGMLCGFSVCMLTGRFSVFTVYMTFAQAALCALCIYLCIKCSRYAKARANRSGVGFLSLPWLLGNVSPLAAAHLLALSAIALGQLLIACGCTLLIQ